MKQLERMAKYADPSGAAVAAFLICIQFNTECDKTDSVP